MGFSAAFDKVFASAHIGHKKPAQEFFLNIIEQYPNIPKDQILFWDDTVENCEGAKEVGILAEVYTSFSDFENKMRNYIS
jgi:HAD superfamily hydrolase (TIGR01509 family)